MLFKTQLELNITIKDITAIYAPDYEAMLLAHARAMYNGRCRDGQYIKSIDKVVKRSLSNLIRADLDAKARVYVVVEATVIRYDKYDIISNLTISRIILAGKIGQYPIIECKNDHVLCMIIVNQSTINSFEGYIEKSKEGDIIPVRVCDSMYQIGGSLIKITAYPFIPHVESVVYHHIKTLSDADTKYFADMLLPLLNRELKRKEDLDVERWNSFADIIYPYKSKERSTSGMVNVLDVSSFQDKILGIDTTTSMKHLKLAVKPANDKGEYNQVIDDNAQRSLTELIFPYVKWLEAVNDMTITYEKKESYDRIEHIITSYINNKL